MSKVVIFTDGACKGNPGPGGWGVVLRYEGQEKQLKGFESHTTNNRMELQAAIAGLSALKRSCEVDLTTDSQYVRQGILQWLPQWKARGWKTSQSKPVRNQELWQELDRLVTHHEVTWHWIKGHSGHEGNELADWLANQAIEEQAAKKK